MMKISRSGAELVSKWKFVNSGGLVKTTAIAGGIHPGQINFSALRQSFGRMDQTIYKFGKDLNWTIFYSNWSSKLPGEEWDRSVDGKLKIASDSEDLFALCTTLTHIDKMLFDIGGDVANFVCGSTNAYEKWSRDVGGSLEITAPASSIEAAQQTLLHIDKMLYELGGDLMNYVFHEYSLYSLNNKSAYDAWRNKIGDELERSDCDASPESLSQILFHIYGMMHVLGENFVIYMNSPEEKRSHDSSSSGGGVLGVAVAALRLMNTMQEMNMRRYQKDPSDLWKSTVGERLQKDDLPTDPAESMQLIVAHLEKIMTDVFQQRET